MDTGVGLIKYASVMAERTCASCPVAILHPAVRNIQSSPVTGRTGVRCARSHCALVQVQVHDARAANGVQTRTRHALARAGTDVTGLQIHYLEG